MTHAEVLGAVSDRLVGGMMFHSEHADLMRMLGIGWLAKLHEHGFMDDSKAYRKARRLCIRHCGMVAPSGNPPQPDALSQLKGHTRGDIRALDAQRMLRASMQEWRTWESGTAKAMAGAADELADSAVLWDAVRGMQFDVEHELAMLEEIMFEMDQCSYDMGHVHDMGR